MSRKQPSQKLQSFWEALPEVVVDQANPTAHGTSSPLFKYFGFQIPCCTKKIGIVLPQVLPLTLSKIQENHFKKISTSLPNSLGLTGLVPGPPGQPRLAAPKESMSWPSTVICAKSCGRFAEHPPCFVDHVPHVRTKNPWMFHIYILYMYVCMYVCVYIYCECTGKTLFPKWSTLLNLPQLCPQHKPNACSFSLTQVAAPTHHLSGFDEMATERMAIGRRSGDLPKSRI